MTPRVSSDIDDAVDVLRSGGLVAIPTETVYGLAARALDEHAVEKIYRVKSRPRSHPLIVHVASLDAAEKWAVFDARARALANHFWPGPLTLLLQRTQIVPDWVTGGRETVALRVPDHVLTLSVIEKLGEGIVAPSANRFGKVSPTTPQHVVDDLDDDVDYVLDGGPCTIGVESTIVECLTSVQILRPGAISANEITEVIHETVSKTHGQSRAPGMLLSHYAPKARVLLCESVDVANAYRSQLRQDNIAHIVIHETDLEVFARTLYERLRQADREQCDVVLVVKAPDHGIGVAINDRLEKAAAQPDLPHQS